MSNTHVTTQNELKKLRKTKKFETYPSESYPLPTDMGDILMGDSLKIMSDGTRIVNGNVYYRPLKSSSMTSSLGKKAEQKIKEWLDRPEEGYCFYRIPDQQTGFYGSVNPCDFILYKTPFIYFIESKTTEKDRFDFTMITDYQYRSLLDKNKIEGVYGVVIILFASYKRAFFININEIQKLIDRGKKSINIKKINKWDFEYREIKTVPNNRKKLLDYQKEDNVL